MSPDERLIEKGVKSALHIFWIVPLLAIEKAAADQPGGICIADLDSGSRASGCQTCERRWRQTDWAGNGCRRYCGKCGTETVFAVGDALQDYAERKMRARIAALPDGTYRFADTYDSSELGRALDVSVEITIAGSEMRLHFESPPQVRAGILIGTLPNENRSLLPGLLRAISQPEQVI